MRMPHKSSAVHRDLGPGVASKKSKVGHVSSRKQGKYTESLHPRNHGKFASKPGGPARHQKLDRVAKRAQAHHEGLKARGITGDRYNRALDRSIALKRAAHESRQGHARELARARLAPKPHERGSAERKDLADRLRKGKARTAKPAPSAPSLKAPNRNTPDRKALAQQIRDKRSGKVKPVGAKEPVTVIEGDYRSRRGEALPPHKPYAKAATAPAPSLKEQAAKHRASKGNRVARIKAKIGARAQAASASAQQHFATHNAAPISDMRTKVDSHNAFTKAERTVKRLTRHATKLKTVDMSPARAKAQAAVKARQVGKTQATPDPNPHGPANPHPSTTRGIGTGNINPHGVRAEKAKTRAAIQTAHTATASARVKERFQRGTYENTGVYREGAVVKVRGTKTITDPHTGKGKVTVPTGHVTIGSRKFTISDQQAVHLASKVGRAPTDSASRAAKVRELIAARARKAKKR